jgi:acetyltransferase-like isoleucine patch superfamily enzyme
MMSDELRQRAGDLVQAAWEWATNVGAIGPNSKRGAKFREFGAGSAICFPPAALFGERYIAIGSGSVVGPYASLSAGVSPEHDLGDVEVVRIGDGCVIGKSAGIVGHERIEIGDGVFTGPNVYITDANHGYEDLSTAIGRQFGEPRPVRIGEHSWLGHGCVVLPGVTIGRHVVIGANAVVHNDLPDRCVAVGNPAQVVRHYEEGEGWVWSHPQHVHPHDVSQISTSQP